MNKNEKNDAFSKIFHQKNRGMLLEKIINNTISYYNKNKIGFFLKKNLDILFKNVEKTQNKINSAYIAKKSTVDYYGIYKGLYVTFEAKSTESDVFYFSNIKDHQHQHLLLIDELGGIAFYLIYFKQANSFWFIKANTLDLKNKKSISVNEIPLIGYPLEIIFPGIIDFIEIINNLFC